jgi:hypothetical protein
LAEDHLGHALAEGAVMVDFGETQVFKGEMAEAGYGFVGRYFLGLNLGEKIAEVFRVHIKKVQL